MAVEKQEGLESDEFPAVKDGAISLERLVAWLEERMGPGLGCQE